MGHEGEKEIEEMFFVPTEDIFADRDVEYIYGSEVDTQIKGNDEYTIGD
jgi:hypothetical protein